MSKELMSRIEQQAAIISQQNEIIESYGDLWITNEKIMAIQSEELECLTNSNNLLIVMNNRLQLELRAIKEELDVCSDDLSSYMRQSNDLVYGPYTNEQTFSMVEDIVDTTEYLREQD